MMKEVYQTIFLSEAKKAVTAVTEKPSGTIELNFSFL